MEGVGGLAKELPVAQHRGVLSVASDEIVSHNHDGDASGANVLLGTGVDDAVLAPVDGSRAEVRGHVADEGLSSGHLIKGELAELEALDGLVVTVVEELGVCVNVPVVGQGGVPVGGVAGDFVGVAVLLSLFDGTLGPGTSGQVVGGLHLTILEQVEADCGELE